MEVSVNSKVQDGAIRDSKERYRAGVLKYRQMGYWDADYQPKDTDVICLFRITPQDGVDPIAAAASMGSTPSWGVMRNRQMTSVSLGW